MVVGWTPPVGREFGALSVHGLAVGRCLSGGPIGGNTSGGPGGGGGGGGGGGTLLGGMLVVGVFPP